MDQNEKRVIDELFDKLAQAERQAGPRDPAAEQAIGEWMRQQPAAPYYMAQAILVQENALATLRQQVEDLQRQLADRPAAGSGSFLGGLFGTGATQPSAPARPAQDREPVMPPGATLSRGWSNAPPAPAGGWSAMPQRGGSGGGFLGGALQAAAGVAGGVLLANAVSGLFASEHARAAEPPAPAHEPPPHDNAPAADPSADDYSFDDGGDFGGLDEF